MIGFQHLPRHFTPDQNLFRDTVRGLMDTQIAPRAAKWREQGFVDPECFRILGENGLLLMFAGADYGGQDQPDLRFVQILQEETVRACGVGFLHSVHSVEAGASLDHLGTQAQKTRYLPGAVSGETILGIAMSEQHAGSDVLALQTRAEDIGDHWRLSGAKTMISLGTVASVFIVAARTGDTRHDISLFLVEADQPGFSRGPLTKKIGLAEQDTADLFFDGITLPRAALLGEVGQGFHHIQKILILARLISAIASLAHAQTAFDLTSNFVLGRRAFGRPIAAFQNTRLRLAELRAELDATQSFVDLCVRQANDARLSTEAAAAVKYATSELEGRVLDRCVQLHGGAGLKEEVRVARMFTAARASRIHGGSSEIMLEVIGRGLGLGDPRSERG